MTTKYERYEEEYEEGREAEPEWEGVEVQTTLGVTWKEADVRSDVRLI